MTKGLISIYSFGNGRHSHPLSILCDHVFLQYKEFVWTTYAYTLENTLENTWLQRMNYTDLFSHTYMRMQPLCATKENVIKVGKMHNNPNTEQDIGESNFNCWMLALLMLIVMPTDGPYNAVYTTEELYEKHSKIDDFVHVPKGGDAIASIRVCNATYAKLQSNNHSYILSEKDENGNFIVPWITKNTPHQYIHDFITIYTDGDVYVSYLLYNIELRNMSMYIDIPILSYPQYFSEEQIEEYKELRNKNLF